ncbi:MAG: hypothetical protein NUV81_01560 [bacterium]|nr:hypothetical protein [bacterium]
MHRMIDQGYSPEKFLGCLQHSRFAGQLLGELLSIASAETGTKLENFARAVFSTPLQFWQGNNKDPDVGFPPEHVAQLVLPQLDAGRFLKKFQGTLCHPNHPMFPFIDPDVFWKERIAKHVRAHALTNAYYQITEANRGLAIPPNFDGDRAPYPAHELVHRATIRAQRDIIRQAHGFMSTECRDEVDFKPVSAEYAKGRFTIEAVIRISGTKSGQARTWLDVKSQIPCMQEAINLDYGETPIEDLPVGLVGLSISQEAQMLLSMAEFFERDRRALSGKTRNM